MFFRVALVVIVFHCCVFGISLLGRLFGHNIFFLKNIFRLISLFYRRRNELINKLYIESSTLKIFSAENVVSSTYW